jgi:DNA-binding NtrC family response regulator
LTSTNGPGGEDNGAAPVRPLHLALREFEQQYLQRALKAGDGKRNRTAAMLGISRKTLWEKLRTSGIAHGDEPEPHDEEAS